jgi:hypothetical protein
MIAKVGWILWSSIENPTMIDRKVTWRNIEIGALRIDGFDRITLLLETVVGDDDCDDYCRIKMSERLQQRENRIW